MSITWAWDCSKPARENDRTVISIEAQGLSDSLQAALFMNIEQLCEFIRNEEQEEEDNG